VAPGTRLGACSCTAVEREGSQFISRLMMQRAGVQACRAGAWRPSKRPKVPKVVRCRPGLLLWEAHLMLTCNHIPIFTHTEYHPSMLVHVLQYCCRVRGGMISTSSNSSHHRTVALSTDMTACIELYLLGTPIRVGV